MVNINETIILSSLIKIDYTEKFAFPLRIHISLKTIAIEYFDQFWITYFTENYCNWIFWPILKDIWFLVEQNYQWRSEGMEAVKK